MPNPCNIIKFDDLTGRIEKSALLLKNRNFNVIGKLKYSELKMSLTGNDLDNISFIVYRVLDGTECAFWDDIEDLKIVDMVGYAQFEISVDKKLSSADQKVITAESLETELGQIILRNMHINDDDYFGDLADSNLDANGNLVPVTLYNPAAKQLQQSDGGFAMRHSLLDMVLMDKAPHWSIGVYPQEVSVNINGTVEKQSITAFQRTFTVDGTSIYDFLTGELADEANLAFVFDTYNRKINVYDKYALGDDTGIVISRRNLAEEIDIASGKDSIKNCFYVTGGDDVITNYLSAVNLTGNYIYAFGEEQLRDMPRGLSDAIRSFIEYKNTWNDAYYGGYQVYEKLKENGKNLFLTDSGTLSSFAALPAPAASALGHFYYVADEQAYYVCDGAQWTPCGAFVRLCSAYDYLNYIEHSMMPGTSLKATTAKEQAAALQSEFQNTSIAVNDLSLYSAGSFTGVTNNVKAYCEVLLDNRYRVELVKETASPSYNPASRIWTGSIRVYKYTDETDEQTCTLTAKINDDARTYVRQKLDKALAKNSMVEMDADIFAYTSENGAAKLREFFAQYSLERLKSFSQGYNACISVLASASGTAAGASGALSDLNAVYAARSAAVESMLSVRTREVDEQNVVLSDCQDEIAAIQSAVDFQKWLTDIDPGYWKLFSAYRREDEYNNPNYISDGLSSGEIIAKCKELLDCAGYQLSIACKPQDTMSITMHNILAKEEFRPLHDQFALYNYIRVKMSEDSFVKMRLLSIDYDFDAPEKLSVTFVSNESGAGNMNADLQSTWETLSSIASSFPSTKHQASQGSAAMSQVGSWIADGLNAAKTMIASSSDNEVTISQGGILCRDMSDDGLFGDVQLKLIGSGLYMTWDAWKTCNLAIGKVLLGNEWRSGIIADHIVGNLLAGQNLLITNSTNAAEQIFKIDGNGALFKRMTIDYQDGSGNGLKIGAGLDRMFSVYSGNEELLWFDAANKRMHLKGTLDAADGVFSGSLSAATGSFSGSIYGGDININNKFVVDRNGNVKLSADSIITFNGGASSLTQYIDDNSLSVNQVTTITNNAISTARISANQITTGTLSGIAIDGAYISAMGIGIYNNSTSSYFTLATAQKEYKKTHNSYGYLTSTSELLDSLRISDGWITIYRDGTVLAEKMICEDIDLPWSTGTTSYSSSISTSDTRIYKVNKETSNNAIPSAGWVKDYVHKHTISGNSLGLNQNYSYTELVTRSNLISTNITVVKADSDTRIVKMGSSTNIATKAYVDDKAGSSDIRLKYDIKKLPNILDSFMNIDLVSFRFFEYDNRITFGAIAQNVNSFYPCDEYSIISKNTEELSDLKKEKCGDFYYTLDYKQLGVLTMKVTQDQQLEIERLGAENRSLKQELDKIKEQLHF